MIRSILVLLISIVIFAPSIQAAEPFVATACRSGTMTVVEGSKALMILGVELKGILQSSTEMFNNTSEICVGVYKGTGEDVTQNGYCKYLYPNGDTNVVEWDGSRNEGKWTYLMGTGKWENIKGGGTCKISKEQNPLLRGLFKIALN